MTSMARLASSIAAVSTMSWLVAPRCTALDRGLRAPAGPGRGPARAPGCRSGRRARRARPGRSSPAWAAAVTASPEPAGASPARSSARASPASASSIACSHAVSPASTPPRAKTPPNSPRRRSAPHGPACPKSVLSRIRLTTIDPTCPPLPDIVRTAASTTPVRSDDLWSDHDRSCSGRRPPPAAQAPCHRDPGPRSHVSYWPGASARWPAGSASYCRCSSPTRAAA